MLIINGLQYDTCALVDLVEMRGYETCRYDYIS